MIDEGYVKFHAEWHQGPAPAGIEELVAARNLMRKMGLIGVYAEIGIGYGNVSQRIGDSQRFVVSGSATGEIEVATAAQFCEVLSHDIETNSLVCVGPVTASSESLTHAMLYDADPAIGAIIHVHHKRFWDHLLENAPTTAEGVAYGTPEMAREMQRLLADTDLGTRRILAMKGHEEGIIAFGGTILEAVEKILEESKGNV